MTARPIIVMTGATSGIGYFAAIELAKRGAHLGLIARSKARAEAARAAILAAAPGTPVDLFMADLASLADVRAVGKEIAAFYPRIDVLISNAGLHAFKHRVTVDGYAEMIGVNYLAPWLLTDVLREKLIASGPARVVVVASESSRYAGAFDPARDITAIEPFKGFTSSRIYGRTKLMNIMFGLELARQLEGTGVTVNCLNPGFNTTGIGRDLSFAGPLEKLLTWLKIGDPRRGAGIIVKLATEPQYGAVTGGYFDVKDAKPLVPAAPSTDPAARKALWDKTRALLG